MSTLLPAFSAFSGVPLNFFSTFFYANRSSSIADVGNMVPRNLYSYSVVRIFRIIGYRQFVDNHWGTNCPPDKI